MIFQVWNNRLKHKTQADFQVISSTSLKWLFLPAQAL